MQLPRTASYDPSLTISQIICLQAFHYLSVATILFILDYTFSEPFSVAQVFSAPLVGFHSRQGWITVAALFTASIPGAISLLYTVERAKRCLDFCATILFLHALIVSLYSGRLPTNWTWWVINAAALVIMTIVGEYLCLKRELAAIPVVKRGPQEI